LRFRRIGEIDGRQCAGIHSDEALRLDLSTVPRRALRLFERTPTGNVILGRQQLFTENTLTVILPLLARKNLATLWRVLRLWGVVLSANLVGTFLLAFCLSRIVLFDAHTQTRLMDIGWEHFGAGFGTVVMRGVFAGWLIALMVWLLPGAESARVSIIIIVTYIVGLAGFNHIVAGSTTALFLVATKSASWTTYFARFFMLGNIIGGVSLVAALGHAQVVGGKS
jgi:formate/nitrite transporter FocA (FNT family)